MKRAFAAVLVAFAGVVVLDVAPAGAHPLGNFTTNVYAGIRVANDHVGVDYVLDFAEIPAVEEIDQADTNHDGAISSQEARAYATSSCLRLATGVHVHVGEDMLTLNVESAKASTPDGQAGLQTVRVECDYRAEESMTGPLRLRFDDSNFTGRIGGHELTAVGDGATILDGPRRESLSHRLMSYPKGMAPLTERSATFDVRPGGPRIAVSSPTAVRALPLPRGMDRFTTAFTGLVARQRLNVIFGVLAILIATALGATHALAPGHGKTVIAAYLISRGGARRVAFILGVTVAVSHTAGVLLLGTIVSTSAGIAPEHLYPFLGTVSGLLFAGLGVALLTRARRLPHSHAGHSHAGPSHAGHSHAGDVDHRYDHDPAELPKTTWRTAILPGLAGGLVPSPSALLVYLGGLAIGRTWFAVLLVAGYGVGIAIMLVAAGYLLNRARSRIERTPSTRRWMTRVRVSLPAITAALVIAGGLQIAVRSLATI